MTISTLTLQDTDLPCRIGVCDFQGFANRSAGRGGKRELGGFRRGAAARDGRSSSRLAGPGVQIDVFRSGNVGGSSSGRRLSPPPRSATILLRISLECRRMLRASRRTRRASSTIRSASPKSGSSSGCCTSGWYHARGRRVRIVNYRRDRLRVLYLHSYSSFIRASEIGWSAPSRSDLESNVSFGKLSYIYKSRSWLRRC